MAGLAAAAAKGRGSDLFGLLAAGGEHALAIPMKYAPASAPPPGGTQPSGNPPPGGGSSSTGLGPPDIRAGGPQGTGANPPTSSIPQPGGGAGGPLGQYDVSSDPVLQQVNAAMALADQNAQATALRNRQQVLLAYGDPTLAGQILGANDPLVQAAGQNQEGTVEQLLRAYQQGLSNFTTGLDPSLAFSGYRVGQEGQIGQAYQDNLAKAAADIQAQLGGYTDSLNAALQADQQQRIQALADAYQRAIQAALTGQGG